MIQPRFQLTLPESNSGARFAPVVIALECLTRINEFHLRRGLRVGQPYPRLYSSGVYYKEEKPGYEDWPDVPNVLSQGWADCEDLAAYLAAERRVYDNIPVEPVIRWKHISRAELLQKGMKGPVPDNGVWLVHCLVRHPDGFIEDPSKVLGMKGEY